MRHFSALIDTDNIGHGFFGRTGGVSVGEYNSLNCGWASGDHMDAITENRRRAVGRIAPSETPLVTARQIHSAKVVTVTEPWNKDNAPECDAMVTKQKNIVLGVLTADCCPILLADNDNHVIAAVHAGWRGALAGVVQQTLHAMQAAGANPAHITAAIGPTIAQDSYEVGDEVLAAFLESDANNAKFFKPSPHDGRLLFDLPGFVMRTLAQSGVNLYENLAMDTYPDQNEFFSYRRTTHSADGQAPQSYGRQLSAIVLL